ncbi:GRAM domain-containing 3 [Apodemus speciosus]|uniref:GRAM domain-containing 3 n=1 Tax=Apodemus speciosus TaxID=105296 RepID=A0ABQ0FR55_APOSI
MTELQQEVEDAKPAKVLTKRESKVGPAHSEAENGVEDRKRLSKSPAAQSPTSSVEAESPDQKRSIGLWSKSSFDGSNLSSDKNDCKTESKTDSKTERKKSSSSSQYKANMHFHKLFLDVPTEEPLRQSFTYTKISIPAFSVTLIKKTKTALLVPNALIIATVTDRNTSVGNSPNPSSPENSFRADCPSSLPLDFNDEFSDLDGVVRQRRQDLEGYSSSGSQTPESENSRDFHVTESQTVLNVTKGETKPPRTDAHGSRAPDGKAKILPAHGQSETIGILHKMEPRKCPTLRHILIFYAIVVCALIISTFYMRYRINTLEERLGSLTSIMDPHSTGQTVASGLASQVQLNVEALCQELTANIVKLEKWYPSRIEVIRLPGTGVTGSKPPHVGAGNQTGVLCKSRELSYLLSHLSRSPSSPAIFNRIQNNLQKLLENGD